jgi:hypothetical protein
MKLVTKHSLLFICIALVGINCKSTENTVIAPPVQQEKTESIADIATPDTSRFISMTINGRVNYEFTKIDTNWTGVAIQFDSSDPQTRKTVREIPLSPTYGWSDFEDMVQFLKIYSMPDQQEIKDRKPGPLTDQSRSYKFTVFDGESTRSYFYYNPEGEASQYWQSQYIITFGSYVTTEMKTIQ